MADNAMTHERRLYRADPRGIGLSRGACMVCGGVADDLRHDCAFFVPSRETGEAIVALFQQGAKLDYRPFEPRWCQVKVTACGMHRHNLESLVAAVSGARDRLDGPGISAEMVADFVTPAVPPASIQGEGGVPESLETPETLEEMGAIFAPYFRNGERSGLVRVLDVSPHYGNEAEREKIRAEICRRWNGWSAQAAEIARLTILASRSELSAVAKALAWEGPYQCSLAGRVKSLVHSSETRKDSLDLLDRVIGALAEELGVEQDNEAMREAIQAIRGERDAALAQAAALTNENEALGYDAAMTRSLRDRMSVLVTEGNQLRRVAICATTLFGFGDIFSPSAERGRVAEAYEVLCDAVRSLSTGATSNFIVIPRDQPPAAHSPDAVE
ncbi:hypothetical protein [Azospirillum cavernae]|nr:hypothetical protein [Azospirillum cavernae]